MEHVVPLPGRELLVLAPRDGESLLSEEAFEREEFLPYWAELWPSAVALARVSRAGRSRGGGCWSWAAGSGCRRSPPPRRAGACSPPTGRRTRWP